jgi:hypothetical protein
VTKKNPNYNFLISYTPSRTHVNRQAKIEAKKEIAVVSVKKDIMKSLILVSLILALEVVVYLVWNKYLS